MKVRFVFGQVGARTEVHDMPGVPGIYEQVIIDGLAHTVSQVIWTPGEDPEVFLALTCVPGWGPGSSRDKSSRDG